MCLLLGCLYRCYVVYPCYIVLRGVSDVCVCFRVFVRICAYLCFKLTPQVERGSRERELKRALDAVKSTMERQAAELSSSTVRIEELLGEVARLEEEGEARDDEAGDLRENVSAAQQGLAEALHLVQLLQVCVCVCVRM